MAATAIRAGPAPNPGPGAAPRAFESTQVPGFVAARTDGPESTTIRVTRSSGTHPPSDTVFSIGTGRQAATGDATGFLLRTDVGANTQTATPLQVFYPSNGALAVMTQPQALLVMDAERTVVVVGAGVIVPPSTGTTLDPGPSGVPMPAVAVVTLRPGGVLCCTQLQVGNADPTFVSEIYNDIVLDPWCCTRAAWLVAATGWAPTSDPDAPRATTLLRRIAMDTLMPDPIGPGGDLYVTPIGAPTYTAAYPTTTPTASVGLATTSAMVVVGAHIQDGGEDPAAALQSFVWATTQDLALLQPSSSTGYNDPTTGRLPLAGGTVGVVLLRVFALLDDSVVVAARGYMGQDAGPSPPCTVQVFRYTADTTLDLGFAAGGVLVWYNNNIVGGSYAMDAALAPAGPGCSTPDGTLYIVGNAFFSGAGGGFSPPMQYVVPGFPFGYLDVSSSFDPFPFAIEVRGYVCGTPGCCAGPGAGPCRPPLQLVRPLFTYMCGCAAHWASSVALTGPLAVLVTGDSWFHLGCPAQAAWVFDVAVGLGWPRGNSTGLSGLSNRRAVGGAGAGGNFSAPGGAGGGPAPLCPVDCSPQLLNNVPVCLSAVTADTCAGAVSVDTLCPPYTVLKVRGPVVVGCMSEPDLESQALEGMIRYDASTHTLLFYDGTSWRTLSSTVVV